MTAAAKQDVATIVQAQGTALTPMEMVERAVASGSGVDVIEKLMALQERWDANQARKAFDAAIAAAKSEIPVIVKNRQVGFDSRKSGAARTEYKHEDFAQIARTIDPILAKHGLAYRFRASSNANEPVTVTCILSHRDGHSEETTLSAGRDESGNKNGIQAIGSTVTYLQRYTLKAALGLASASDDDAAAAGDIPNTLTTEQVEQMRTLIVERGANLGAFLQWARVEKIEDIRQDYFESCMAAIRRTGK